MSVGKTHKQSFCVLCAHDIKGSMCPHPWDKGFEDWPPDLLYKLTDLLPLGQHEGS